MDKREKCSISFPGDDEFSVTEDLELAQEMGALGLPISFSTNKEKRNGRPKGKLKNGRGKVTLTKNFGSVQFRTHGMSDLVNAVSSQCSPDINEEFHQVTFDTDDNNQNKAIVPHENEMDLGRKNAEETICEENGAIAVIEKVNGITIEHECLDIADIKAHPLDSNTSAKLEFSSEDPSHECSSYLHDGLVKDGNSQTESCFDSVRDSVSEFVDFGTPGCCLLEHTELMGCSLVVDHGNDHTSDGDRGAVASHGWIVIWDTFYEENYFYNILTEESTWYPPPGFEEYQSFSLKDDAKISDVMRGISDIDTQAELPVGIDACRSQVNDSFMIRETNGNLAMETRKPLDEIMPSLSEVSEDFISDDTIPGLQCPCNAEHGGALDLYRVNNFSYCEKTLNMASHTPECIYYGNRFTTGFNGLGLEEIGERERLPSEMIHREHEQENCMDVAISKTKKKATRIKSRRKNTSYERNVLPEASSEVAKYWCQRYSLFSRFDCGIKMDIEGWYSVTPEKIAKHQASRCGNGIFIDCFTGVGGNAIQFAMKSKHVMAIDIDPMKIDCARHNATIYGVQDHIDFVLGDFFHLTLKGDVVFLSPPWGGPDYGKVQTYDIQTMLQPHNADLLFKTASKISPCVVMFLPRNVNINQLAELALMSNPPCKLEVEKNFLNGKLKAITAYFHDTSRCAS